VDTPRHAASLTPYYSVVEQAKVKGRFSRGEGGSARGEDGAEEAARPPGAGALDTSVEGLSGPPALVSQVSLVGGARPKRSSVRWVVTFEMAQLGVSSDVKADTMGVTADTIGVTEGNVVERVVITGAFPAPSPPALHPRCRFPCPVPSSG
jgi:hypothetical protein